MKALSTVNVCVVRKKWCGVTGVQGRRHGVDMSTPLLPGVTSFPRLMQIRWVFFGRRGSGSVMVWSFTHPHITLLYVKFKMTILEFAVLSISALQFKIPFCWCPCHRGGYLQSFDMILTQLLGVWEVCKVRRMKQFWCFRWEPKHKRFSASGGLLDPAVSSAPDPRIGTSSARSPYVSTTHCLTWRRSCWSTLSNQLETNRYTARLPPLHAVFLDNYRLQITRKKTKQFRWSNVFDDVQWPIDDFGLVYGFGVHV